MLRHRHLFVLGLLFAISSSLMGQYQSYYYITGNVDQGAKYSFGTSGGTYNSLIPGVDDLIAAVGGLQHVTEIQWNNFKYYGDQALLNYTTTAAAAATVGTNITAMNVNLKAMVNDLEGLRTVMGNAQSNQVNALTLNTAELLALKNGIAPFGTVLSNAVIAGSTTAANILNSGINSNLFAIKGILLTNTFGGSNSIVVNATNGGVQLTNVINVNVPSMANMNNLATRTMDTADANVNANNAILSPSGATPSGNSFVGLLGGVTNPTVDVAGDSASAFLISVPRPGGGANIVFDLNPMTHFGGVISAFRIALTWVCYLGFTYASVKLAGEFFNGAGAAQQLKIPNVMVFGNSVGALSAPIFIAVYVAIALAFSAACASVIDTSALSSLGLDPFRDFGRASVWMANLFFPLALICSQAVWLLMNRITLQAASWTYMMAVRAMASV